MWRKNEIDTILHVILPKFLQIQLRDIYVTVFGQGSRGSLQLEGSGCLPDPTDLDREAGQIEKKK